jgi:glycosyltransferase involved in cell wall biosynthesis
MPDDRVTILLPVTHYHPGFLRQAIESVFAQTRNDWRLLVVVNREDEAHFQEVLAEPFGDSRVGLVRNRGQRLAGSYNSAMAAAETEFIAALMGDDLLDPATVETLGRAILAHPDTDFFITGRYFVDADCRRISSDYLPTRPVTREMFIQRSPVKHLMCWRARRGLACGGVDETLENFGSDDYDFPWTMLEHGAVFTPIQRALYLFRDHREAFRLTTHVPRSVQIRTLRRILEKHGVGPRETRRRIREARRGYLRQSLFRNPLDRWLRASLGLKPRPGQGWRESYR